MGFSHFRLKERGVAWKLNPSRSKTQSAGFTMEGKTRDMTRGEKGFTLVELMIVVAMLGIVAFMAYPSIMGAIQNYKIRSAASDIAGNIKLTRAYAIKEATRNYLITFNSTSKLYNIGYENTGDLVPDGFGTGAPRVVSLGNYGTSDIIFGSDAPNGPPGSPVNSGPVPGNGINVSGTPPNIRFNSDGSVTNVGGIFIKDGVGNNYCISIDAIVGTVILWRWEGGNNWKKIF